jgi:hypothetical protein
MLWNEQIKEDKMARTCSTRGREINKKFGRKTRNKNAARKTQ